jgi:hypothetical protein
VVLLALLAATVEVAASAQLIRVPQDAPLQKALDDVSDGGEIEIAAGTYAAPTNGFRIRRLGKNFTVRAAAGAQVALSGEGSHTIFDIEGRGEADGPVVRFESLTFQDGFGASIVQGGAVSLNGARAAFDGCDFRNNRASHAGGAVQIRGGGDAHFSDSRLQNNSAFKRGGAVDVTFSSASFRRAELLDNRLNRPGDDAGSIGGAVYVLDSDVSIEQSRFAGNQASWVGGALYAFGTFGEPGNAPATRVTITHSTFVDNIAISDPCCPSPGVSTGGAIHVEDHVLLTIRASRFLENRSERGGAISGYRSVIGIHDSTFRGNAGALLGEVTSVGGTILLQAADFADSSTNFGVFNRPAGSLTVARTLIQGRFGGTQEAASRGACISASGDVTRELGGGQVEPAGPTEVNRVVVSLTDTVLFECDAGGLDGKTRRGGGLHVNLADVTLERSLVLDSDALGSGGSGGGLMASERSVVRLVDTTFAGNRAERRGGGLYVVDDSQLQVQGGAFLHNEVGDSQVIQQSLGAAMITGGLVQGVVADALFSGNVGLPIYEEAGNRVRYDGNRFVPGTFGDRVYFAHDVNTNGTTINQLNNLVIQHGGGTSTKKSEVPNQKVVAGTKSGSVVAAPSLVLTTSAAGDPPPPVSAFLGFAWSGGAGATLGGLAVPGRTGVLEVGEAGSYPLRVGGTKVDEATVGESNGLCLSGLCLNQGRFRVEVQWRDFQGNVGEGEVVPFGSDDSGLFYFFNADNWEMLVKVLRGCGLNQHYWVFAAATTNVEYTLTVTDTATGDDQTYFNPLGTRAAAITDTSAFRTCDAGLEQGMATPFEPDAFRRDLVDLDRTLGQRMRRRAATQADCTPTAETLCLNEQRFRVEVEWRDFQGNVGMGQVVPFGSDDSGLFYFFGADNWEMLVKVLRGCGLNQHYWVFAAATTNVEYTLTVTDTATGKRQSYENALGERAPAITDTSAFATCP